MTAPRSIAGLQPLSSSGFQTYFCDNAQLADVIEWALEQTGAARLSISSFSVGEEFLRRLWRLKRSGAVTECLLLLDVRALRKTRLLASFMSTVADRVMVGSNHSKVVIIDGTAMSAVIVTSQNLTRGNRAEAGTVSADAAAVESVRARFNELLKKSTCIYEIDRRTD